MKVLFALTSHSEKGETGQPTGFYVSEAAHPWGILQGEGIETDFVSPEGGEPPMDGVNPDDPAQKAFLEDAEVSKKLKNTLRPEQVDPSDYDAILYVGGHGTMWDFPENEELAHTAATIYESGGAVSAVCHGPAGLVNIKLSDGEYLVAGKTVSAFTDDEERAVGLEKVVPFLLESKLVERGARHTKADNFQAHVEVDDRLITGQNPASAAGVGEALVRVLNARPARV